VRRLRVGRFSQIETAELLKNVLGGPVEPASATAMQVQDDGKVESAFGCPDICDVAGPFTVGRICGKIAVQPVRCDT